MGVWQRMSELTHFHEQSMNQVHLPEEKTGPDVIQSYPWYMMRFSQYQATLAALGYGNREINYACFVLCTENSPVSSYHYWD